MASFQVSELGNKMCSAGCLEENALWLDETIWDSCNALLNYAL